MIARSLVAWLTLLLAPAAGAVIIASGDGTGNTTAPPDDPGWANVVNLSGLTGVYLGEGWVLTANHVGARNMLLDGQSYAPVPGSKVQLQADGSNADLALFRIVRDPGLPGVWIRRTPPPAGAEVVIIGRGRSRGASTTACEPPRQGWLWAPPNVMRWGRNVVEANGIDLALGGLVTRSFATEFSETGQVADEAQAANGDSGGAAFVESGGVWELAGILFAIGPFECQPASSAIYGNWTYAADLSHYVDQIDATTAVPACDDGLDQDGDGLTDHPDDPGCDSAEDPFETADALPCDDGIDDDGDGLTDSGEDPGCGDPWSAREDPACQDGLNNDPAEDGWIDFDGGLSAGVPAEQLTAPDPHCSRPWRDSELPPGAGFQCGLGFELGLLIPLLLWLRRRRDG